MSKVHALVVSSLLFAMTACGQGKPPMEPSSDPSKEISAEDAKTRAAAAVPGGVAGDAKKEDDGDDHEWLVDVKLPSGAALVVEVERKNGEVGEIKGEKAPFDYDFSPAVGLVHFADAKAKALAAKAGELKEWEIDLEKSVYELEIVAADGKTYEVKLDAKSGTVKSIEEKKPEKPKG